MKSGASASSSSEPQNSSPPSEFVISTSISVPFVAHFICDDCDNTLCIEEIDFPKIKKIKGFKFKKIELIIQGSCPKCL